MSIDVSVAVEAGSGRRTAENQSSFFFWMSLLFVAIASTGFARSYLIPVATNAFEGPAILHLHSALFFAWTLLLVLQTRLVARHRVDLHRALGLAGISLATGMVFTAVALIVRALSSPAVAANPSLAGPLAAIPLSQMALFTGFFIAGIANLRRPETHKRCMLLATVNLLAAPIARILFVIVAPESGILGSIASVSASDLGARLISGIGGGIAIVLIVLVAILYDWRALGRVHRVYVVGIASMLLTQLLRMPLAQTTVWRSITDALTALGS